MDQSLAVARGQWEGLLEKGDAALLCGMTSEALDAFPEAVRISARFHPLYHFLESGLNTELAALAAEAGRYGEAAGYFSRALFLDHTNPAAAEGERAAKEGQAGILPPYPFMEMVRELPLGEIHALREAARQEQGETAIAPYGQAIELCEETHREYHRLAALPWLARARVFLAQGERLLARNDARRGLDLDPKHPGLLGIGAIQP